MMLLCETLILVKPDAISRQLTDEILSRFTRCGMQIARMKSVIVDVSKLERHYSHLINKPYWQDIVADLNNKQVKAVHLYGYAEQPDMFHLKVRNIIGDTHPLHALPGTIRGDYGIDIGRNLVHGSDSAEAAEKELQIWFGRKLRSTTDLLIYPISKLSTYYRS